MTAIVLAAAALLIGYGNGPQGGSRNHIATLSCGGSRFEAASSQLQGTDAPLAPRTQTLAIVTGRARKAVLVEPGRRIVLRGRQVLQAYVISWACVRASTGRSYVTLGYACAVDPGEPNDCGGDKEWFRWIDTRGRAVDAGVSRDGAASNRLQRRLGLSRVAEAEIAMVPTLPD